jgi:hypothetical protein
VNQRTSPCFYSASEVPSWNLLSYLSLARKFEMFSNQSQWLRMAQDPILLIFCGMSTILFPTWRDRRIHPKTRSIYFQRNHLIFITSWLEISTTIIFLRGPGVVIQHFIHLNQCPGVRHSVSQKTGVLGFVLKEKQPQCRRSRRRKEVSSSSFPVHLHLFIVRGNRTLKRGQRSTKIQRLSQQP